MATEDRRRTREAAELRTALSLRPDLLRRYLRSLGRVAPDRDALRLQRLRLRLRRAGRAGDDRAGVAHALAGRRLEAGDVGDHRLRHVLADVLGGALLLVAADLAHHHDQLGLGVLLEQRDHVDERGADDRVAADSDDRGVADAELGQLVADLVGERPRARHEPDPPWEKKSAGMMPTFALPGDSTPGQFGPISRESVP